MPSQKFRKLDIDLPRQPLSNQRPWLFAGLFLAILILLMCAYAYFNHLKKEDSKGKQQRSSFRKNEVPKD